MTGIGQSGRPRRPRLSSRPGRPADPSGLHLRRGPAREDLYPVPRPGAVAGHGPVAEAFQDVRGMSLDVLVGPEVEREAHRVLVPLAEQRLDVGGEADRLAGPGEGHWLGRFLPGLPDRAPRRPGRAPD